MISTTWDWMWKKHDELKEAFFLFVKPHPSKLTAKRQLIQLIILVVIIMGNIDTIDQHKKLV
ncbi:hypothetical protein GCM10008934_28120 [Virgibacillus salarius]